MGSAPASAAFSRFYRLLRLYLPFLSLLEHSGYMDRAARILDRPMNQIGLSGKAILPLVTGFGCSVPAILAAGTLSSHRDRKLTIAMIPFLSCSAKLPIYLILTQVFSQAIASSPCC